MLALCHIYFQSLYVCEHACVLEMGKGLPYLYCFIMDKNKYLFFFLTGGNTQNLLFILGCGRQMMFQEILFYFIIQ